MRSKALHTTSLFSAASSCVPPPETTAPLVDATPITRSMSSECCLQELES